MNVAIFGATGTTGQFVLEEALARGHRVTALVRNPGKLDGRHDNLTVLTGDVLDAEAVEKTIIGQDAVLSVLGAGMRPTTLRTDGNRTIVAAMQRQGVRRLVSMSVFGLGDSAKKLPLYWKLLVKPLFLRFAYRDHAGQEAVVSSSDLDWTLTRPVSLRDVEATGHYQHGAAATMGKITLEIGLTDFARFTLDQLESDDYVRQSPGISY
ncbi:MAG: SDR family oxidoreductase [Acidimicrobiia bacterium]|nr:SDR family oxidoreductase [Acidimicrobiia bacterium]